MAGYIANHIDGLTKTAVGIVKEWLEQEPDITDVTQIIAQTALFNKFEGTGRMAALDVADRHPEFQPAAQTIRANTSALRSAAGDEYATILSKELDQIITFLGNAGFNDDPDYYSLLAAYVGWGFKNRKEEVDPKMQEFFSVPDKQESLSERTAVNLIMAMWFWDYDGFQNRVMAAFAQPAAQPAMRPDGFITKNFDSLAATAVEIAKMAGGEITYEKVQNEVFRQFLAAGRNGVARQIADKYPEFEEVAQTIEKDTMEMVNLPGEEFPAYLSKEFDMMMPFFASADWYNDPDYLALLQAYACWGFKDRKEENQTSIQRVFDLLDQQESLSGGAKIDLMIALWMWDYSGFQDRVMAFASSAAAASQSGAAAAPSPDGYIAQKMDALVNLVINLAKQEGSDFTQQSIEDMLYFDWLSKRQSIAQVIAGKHPVFNTFAQKVAADDLIITNPASSPEAMRGALEQEAMQVAECNSQSELAQDVDFVSLLLVFTCWVYKDNKEEYKDAPTPFFAVLDAQSEQSPASLTNLVTALWLWDYDNFQGRVMQRIQDAINLMQAKRQEYRRQGVCQYCGGAFKGMLSKKCSVCGRPKDY